jgi:acyl carrier protein
MREEPALSSADLRAEIRTLVARHGRMAIDVAAVGDRMDLYEAGMTSMASVNLMLALEEHFDIQFPEHLLERRTFSSIAAISDAVSALRNETTP